MYHLFDGAASIWDVAQMAEMDATHMYYYMEKQGWVKVGYDADGNETFAPPVGVTLDAAIERLKREG